MSAFSIFWPLRIGSQAHSSVCPPTKSCLLVGMLEKVTLGQRVDTRLRAMLICGPTTPLCWGMWSTRCCTSTEYWSTPGHTGRRPIPALTLTARSEPPLGPALRSSMAAWTTFDCTLDSSLLQRSMRSLILHRRLPCHQLHHRPYRPLCHHLCHRQCQRDSRQVNP